MLILGILPQGYIYPKEDRPVRDLARKRLFLVRHRTSHILSLQSLIARCCAQRVSANDIRKFTVEDLQQLLKEEHIVLSAQANLDTIVFLKQQIQRLEKTIQNNYFNSNSIIPAEFTQRIGTCVLHNQHIES
jgi:hypothetical protein